MSYAPLINLDHRMRTVSDYLRSETSHGWSRSTTARLVLMTIAANDGMRLADIAAVAGTTASTVGRHVGYWNDAGILYSKPNAIPGGARWWFFDENVVRRQLDRPPVTVRPLA